MRVMHSLRRVQRAASYLENKLQALPPTLARLTVGYAFLITGWGKLHNLERVTQFFSSLSIPAPAFHATFVACIEFGCGGLLLLGSPRRHFHPKSLLTLCKLDIRHSKSCERSVTC